MTTRHLLFAMLLGGLLAGPAPAVSLEMTSYRSGIGSNALAQPTLLDLVCASSVGFNGDFNPCDGIGEPITVPADLIDTARDLVRRAPSIVDRMRGPCFRPGTRPGTAPPDCDPLFQNELSILSWNLLVTLVASSSGPPNDSGSFDGSAPYRLSGCSYANPGACLGVQQALAPEAGTALSLCLGLVLLGLRARRG